MSMDHREGGGAGKSLHRLCDQLDIRGVPYVVRELKIADYVFFGKPMFLSSYQLILITFFADLKCSQLSLQLETSSLQF